jgi:predicted CopG family antitoxin
MVSNKTIVISQDTKERLEFLKIIPQEPFDAVIRRLLDIYDKQEKK